MSGEAMQPLADRADAGREALARGAWQEARAHFEAALAVGETPEALEGLGMAAWWLGEGATTFDARERAYQLYRARRDVCGAARLAAALAIDHCTFRGAAVVAQGWAQRAERLLQGKAGAERCLLRIAQAHLALMIEHKPDAAHGLAAEARALGKALDDANLEMLALAYVGLALVDLGRVGEGMRCLDEATVAAVSGEMSDVDARCTACCCLIYACERTRDLERAAQWCAQLEAHARTHSYQLMFTLCRVHYAGILLWRGDWTQAEAVLMEAIGELERTHRAETAEALVKLGALRCGQGRLEDAAALFARAETPPYRTLARSACLVARAALALEQDDSESALALLRRYSRAVPPPEKLEQAAALELAVRAHVNLGEIEEAEDALRALRKLARLAATRPMQAALRFAEGVVAAVTDPALAKPCFEDAAELYERSEAPLETARTRIELARVLERLGRMEGARKEARFALAAFRELGAAHAADRAAALVHELERPVRLASTPPPTETRLTPRQRELLCLLAQGLSNAKIAAKLGISPHTVKRHVANILTRLDLPSRAAAAAHAARSRLI